MSYLRQWTRILRRDLRPRLRTTGGLVLPLSLTWARATAGSTNWQRYPYTRRHTWLTHRRSYSTTQYQPSTLSEGEYHDISTRVMDELFDNLEAINDKHEIPGFDVEYSSGVLTLSLGPHGTYVINKQPPNKQIWLSSPHSGPKRFDYDVEHRVWFYGRDHTTLHGLLNHELSEIVGQSVSVL